ncbi:MAG TPA: sigma-54 dependent transcriptional regulator [Terriglobales bacterium]|jgi:DNA-binding NtrC family response regulator
MTDKNPALIKLLAIDDDPLFLGMIGSALSRENLQILTTTDPVAGLDLFMRTRPRIVLVDLVMPNITGIEVLEKIVAADPGTEVILITGNYSPESAVEAIQKGACDYLPKPIDVEKLRTRVESLVSEAELRKRSFQLDAALLDAYQFQGMIGRSPLMLDLFARIRRVAPHYRNLLISGETGTGKELVARALHQMSPVGSASFCVCNCSAIVETLLESELFGHVKGAFTGAAQDKIGIFEYASGGTVFLDEIGELPLEAQAKLLRVLQNQEVQRVGSPAPRSVDVHVVAATNRDLRKMVAEGRFREDLYYRLAMVELKLPRLVDRKEDLVLLQRHFLAKFARQYQKPLTGITRRAQIRLGRHHWPGNVRELENVIGNASMMAEGQLIDVHDLPESLNGDPDLATAPDTDLLTLQEVQQRHLLRVLERVGGNKARAAEVLGVSRTTIYEMLASIDGRNKKPQHSAKAAGTPA